MTSILAIHLAHDYHFNEHHGRSVVWPDSFCTAAYQLESISATLQGSGLVCDLKNNYSHQWLVNVN